MLKKFIYFILLLFSFSYTYSLKITEVYFDWNSEYIWIYNDKDHDFTWTISISWAKSKTIDISLDIDKNQEIIIWDSWINKYFSWFSNFQNNLTLQIVDTKSIDIKLLSWTKILDSFFVSEDNLKLVNDKKTAFEKTFSKGSRHIDKVKKSRNMSNWYFGNPWFVSWIHDTNEDNPNNSENSWNKDNPKFLNCYIDLIRQNKNHYSLEFVWNRDFKNIRWNINNNEVHRNDSKFSQHFSTWNHFIEAIWEFKSSKCYSYFVVSNSETETKAKNIFTWYLQINEINASNNIFPEYVELKAIWNVSWDFIFNWFTHWNKNISIPVKLYSWNILLITKDKQKFKHTESILELSKLSISDRWWVLSIWQDGQVMDKVKYLSPNPVYFSYKSWDIRYFYKESQATAWYENFASFYQKDNLSCKILSQSYKVDSNKIKLNLKSNVSNKSLCSNDDYEKIRTYSWWTLTWTCNPNIINLDLDDNNIMFKISDKSWKIICSDTYKILFFKPKLKDYNLNCSIKIQNQKNPLFSNNSVNLISTINWKQVQNSNKHFSCKYYLSGQIFSEKCNPASYKFPWWIHDISLKVTWDNWKTCITNFYLNLPNSRNLDKQVIDKLNSKDLKMLVENIKNKYKSKQTLRNIFKPISYLYPSRRRNLRNTLDAEDCAKLNSNKLRELTIQVKNKYKSKRTLNKIFNPISSMYVQQNNIDKKCLNPKLKLKNRDAFTGNIQIHKILANPVWKDSWSEVLVLSWDFLSWLKIWNNKKKHTLYGALNKKHISIFTWSFNFNNKSWCYSLFYKDKILDTKCYIQVKVWEFVKLFWPKVEDTFLWNYIFTNWTIIENKPLIGIKNRLNKSAKKLKKVYSKLENKNKKLKKEQAKTYKILLKRLWQYIDYKQRYTKLKENNKLKNNKKSQQIKKKNKQIKNLNNLRIYLRSFIVHVKKHIPKDLYRQYLDNYKKAQKWEKIRF